jgi:hypothetical protein
VERLRVPTSHVERSSSTGRAAPRGTGRSATRSSDFTSVPRGTPPHPEKSVPRGTRARVARERSSPRLTGHSIPPVPNVAEAHRPCHTRRLHREPKAPLSPRCFGRSGGCQRSNAFRETAAQSGRMTRNFWAGRGMANQRAIARWSQVMRVDQSRGGGMAMVACLAPHDQRSRLHACCTIFRA